MVKRIKSVYEETSINRKEVLKTMDRGLAVKIYTNMVRVRCFDEKTYQLIQKGHHISLHATTGQEGTPMVATALSAASGYNDYLMPYHRGFAWPLGKGMSSAKILAELIGRKDGTCKGMGGPQAAFDLENRVMGRPGIQGAHLSISVGIGMAIKQRKGKEMCITACGEGATNTGNFHEALNMVGTWKLPMIYFVENNGYQLSTKMSEGFAIEDIALRGMGYGIPGIIVDGNDVVALYGLLSEVMPLVRQGHGPLLIEAKTYRFEGHNISDKYHYGGYRTKEEVEERKKLCPIIRFEADMLAEGIMSEQEIKSVWDKAREEMEEGAKFASNSPYPSEEDYFSGVYCD